MALSKQYPDLWVNKTIMYVHGFASSAQSGTVRRIRDTFPQAKVIAHDLPIHPEEAMALLRRVCGEQKPDLIIGTSMGGMYTEMLYGYDRILVNPAFQMGETMHEHGLTGKQVFMNPRQDGVQEFIVTKALVKEYKDMTTHCFAQVDDRERRRVWGLFGDEDTLVHTFDLFRQHYPQALHFHGEHRMTDHSFFHGIVPVMRWIDDRQEGRERPIVYIHVNAMIDSYGKPMSCFNKAYEMLIERYNVYIVASASTNNHKGLTDTQLWIEHFLSTPAHDRVIFTNQKALLYGDYFIDSAPDENFMGTNITFGSDEMKTWEEVITFFDRLGGQ
ncbi:MAG: esterase [Prevotella sp.]|nr:esterase [Prevotella sp.]